MANPLESAIKGSNAAPDNADHGHEHDSPWECGYNTIEAEPTVPLVQSQVPGQGAAIGGVQHGTSIDSYMLQTPETSATSGMPAPKK